MSNLVHVPQQKRFAFDTLAQMYENQIVQDVLETLLGTGLVAGSQAAFTDMTPEDIAKAGLVGMTFGFAGRPLGAMTGSAIGRQLDKKPGRGEAVRDNYNKVREFFNFIPGRKEMNNKQYETSLKGRGPSEGALNYLGRQQGDLLLQSGVGLITPHIFGGTELEELI